MPGVNLLIAKNKAIHEAIMRYALSGLDLYVNDITTNSGIPTFASIVVLESGNGPAAAVGAASRLDPELAILKSIEEAAHTRFWVKTMMGRNPHYKPKKDFSNIKDLSHHPLLYGYRRMYPKIDFMTKQPCTIDINELPNRSSGKILSDIERCVELILGMGFDVIVVDITTPDVADVGFSVVRIVVPGMQPLDVEFKYRYLGGKRLYEVPPLLGYPQKKEEELNPYPHPFP